MQNFIHCVAVETTCNLSFLVDTKPRIGTSIFHDPDDDFAANDVVKSIEPKDVADWERYPFLDHGDRS